jgi:hypothetical protein
MVTTQLQYGTVPEWMAAIGTVGTLVVALYILMRELKQFRGERWDERRRQARLIAAWIELDPRRSTVSPYVRNLSDEPVMDIKVIAPTPVAGDIVVMERDLVPPRETVGDQVKVVEDVAKRNKQSCVVLFTDAKGHRWRRDGGNPPELTSGE